MNSFRTLLPAMMTFLKTSIEQGRFDDAQATLEVFVDISDVCPSFFRPSLREFVVTIGTICRAPSIPFEMRDFAIEVLITLTENLPVMTKKIPEFVQSMFDLLLSLMMQQTDENVKEWLEGDTPDAFTVVDNACNFMGRICEALHGKTVVPVLYGRINSLITGAEWQKRFAALSAMTMSISGCKDVLEMHLDELFAQASRLTQDAHPRVQWVAFNALAELVMAYDPVLQATHLPELLQVLVVGVQSTIPRVQSPAVLCALALIESLSEADDISASAKALLPILGPCLVKASLESAGDILDCVSAIAKKYGKEFAVFYDAYLQPVRALISRSAAEQNWELRGRALSCLCSAGVAVGKERFAKDALTVLGEMLNSRVFSADDPQVPFLEEGFATIAMCLKEDFAPFLPMVIAPTLQRAGTKPETQDLSANPNLEAGWDVVPLNEDESVGVHTEQVNSIAAAISVLGIYADNLPVAFFPYTEQLLRIAIPHLKSIAFDSLRTASYSCLPGVISVAKAHGDPVLLQRAWSIIRASFTERLPVEVDNDVLIQGLNSLADCVSMFEEDAAACMNPDQLDSLCTSLASIIDEWQDDIIELYDMAHEAANGMDEGDEDEIDEDNFAESSVAAQDDKNVDAAQKELLDALKDAICGAIERIAANQKNAFYDVYQRLFAKRVRDMCKNTNLMMEKQLALYLMAVVCDHCPFAAFNSLDEIVPYFMQYSTAKGDSQLRQEALYGIGALAATLGDTFSEYLTQSLKNISAVLRDPRAFSTSKAAASETAVASLGKILRYHEARIPAAHIVFTSWLRHLPLKCDEEEARICHSNLVILLQRPAFLSAVESDPQMCIHVAKIFASIVNTPLLSSEDHPVIRKILIQLSSHIPRDQISAVSPEDQARLTSFMNSS